MPEPGRAETASPFQSPSPSQPSPFSSPASPSPAATAGTFQPDDLGWDGPRQPLCRLAAHAAGAEPSADADANDGPRREIPAAPVSFDQRVYAAVLLIPAGRLATYGQIAELIGAWGCARQVGWALRRLPLPSPVPWQRVVNAAGRIAMTPSREGSDWIQRELLLVEGIPVDPDGRLPLARFRWCPDILPPMAAAQSPPQI